MKFLITGATGFIGQRVVNAALEAGHEVTVLTRDIAKARAIWGDKVTYLALEALLAGANLDAAKAIHLAWADVQNYMDESNMAANLAEQQRLLQAIIDAGIRDITVTGTCLEYGMVEGACREDQQPGPLATTYARAKTQLYHTLSALPGLTLKWVRIFYVYGRGQRPNSLFTQLLNAIDSGQREFNLSPGDQQRDFIHLDTLAHNVVAIAAQDTVTGIINMGNGVPTSVYDFVQGILAARNCTMTLNRGVYPYAAYEPRHFWADVTKLKSVAGVRFDEGWRA